MEQSDVSDYPRVRIIVFSMMMMTMIIHRFYVGDLLNCASAKYTRTRLNFFSDVIQSRLSRI